MRDNRKIIQSKLNEIVPIVREHGVEAIGRLGNLKYSKYSRKAVFFRVIDTDGNVKFQTNPEIWDEFRAASRSVSNTGVWQYVPSTKDGDVFELATAL